MAQPHLGVGHLFAFDFSVLCKLFEGKVLFYHKTSPLLTLARIRFDGNDWPKLLAGAFVKKFRARITRKLWLATLISYDEASKLK